MSADIAFYQRRVAQERRLADGSATPAARRIHRELAERYARLIEDAGAEALAAD